MTPRDPPTAIQRNLRSRAAQVAGGVTGASTVAVLAAAVLPAIGLVLSPIVVWLRGIGGNALANWLDAWWRSQVDTPEADQLEALASAIEAQMVAGQRVAGEVALLFQQSRMRPPTRWCCGRQRSSRKAWQGAG